MEIRKCTVGDAARLASLTEKTFRKTFGGSCSPQDMERYVEEDMTAEKFADELSREGSVFFAAEDNGNILGYIKINEGSEQTEKMPDGWMEIQRLYAAADSAGVGVGSALMTRAFGYAREKGAEKLWLGVWEHNENAKRFYRNRGFGFFGSHDFFVGTDRQTDLLMSADVNSSARIW